MKKDTTFDEILKRKISEVLDETIDEDMDADDLMFDLGMRYLRMTAAHRKKKNAKKENLLSLWVENAKSRRALTDYVSEVTNKNGPDYIFTIA